MPTKPAAVTDPVARTLRSRWRIAALVVTLLAIGLLTLIPEPGAPRPEVGLCFVCDEYPLTDALLNIALFIPLGAALAALGVSRQRAFRLALALTVTIELLQLTVIAGRDPSLRDVMMNALGASLGFRVATSWRRWLAPAPTEQRIFAWAAAAGIVAVMLVSGWAMTPSLPDTPYNGLLAPQLARMATFGGTVISAHAGDAPLLPGPITDVDLLRGEMRRNGPSLDGLVQLGETPRGFAPIVAIYDRYRKQIAILMQDGDALHFRVRLKAAEIGLRNPGIVLRGVFDPRAAAARDTLRIAGRWHEGTMQVTAGPRNAAQQVVMGPALGWTLLLPFDLDLAGPLRFLSLAWLFGLYLPLGYWIGRGSGLSRGERGAAAAAALLLGLGGVPLLTRSPLSAPVDWLGAVLGLLVGGWCGRLLARGEPGLPNAGAERDGTPQRAKAP